MSGPIIPSERDSRDSRLQSERGGGEALSLAAAAAQQTEGRGYPLRGPPLLGGVVASKNGVSEFRRNRKGNSEGIGDRGDGE